MGCGGLLLLLGGCVLAFAPDGDKVLRNGILTFVAGGFVLWQGTAWRKRLEAKEQ
jgi:hypothetical protein